MFSKPLQLLSFLSLLGLASCAKVDMPEGTSKGYTSARLTQISPSAQSSGPSNENEIHRMIQNSLSAQFKANGLSYGTSNADLIVAYMVFYQEPGMTTSSDKYFGYNPDATKIADIAHMKGAVDSDRRDYFRQGGVLVDIIDSRTNKLVFRNLAKGDVVKGVSSETRAAKINAGIAQALAPFFKK